MDRRNQRKEPPARKWKWIRPTKFKIADDAALERIINPPPRYPEPEFKGHEYIHGPEVESDYIFMCPEVNCFAKFTTATSLKFHSVKHRDPLIKCQFCGVRFKAEEEKRLHCAEFHPDLERNPGANPLQCKKCGKISRDTRALWRHVRESHREQSYQCQYCQFPFTRPENLKEHLKKMHPVEEGITPEKFTCTICGKEYRHKNSIRTHIRQIHRGSPDRTFRCVLCNTEYTNKIVYDRHMKWHTNPVFYPCNICNVKFRTTSHLRRHESSYIHKRMTRKIKSNPEKTDFFPAPLIRTVGTVNANLTTQDLINLCKQTCVKIRLHRVDEQIVRSSKYKVEKLRRRSKEKSQTGQKLQLREGEGTKDKYLTCFYCNREYPDLQVIKAHEKVCYLKLRSRKLIMCPICNREFDRPFKLKIHAQTHKREKVRPFKCFHCDARYTSNYVRAAHVKRAHFDIRTPLTKYIYKCSFEGCEKHYANHSGLKEHMESRHSETRQRCDQCGRTFRTQRLLCRHLRFVHAECPTLLQCRPCNRVYKDKSTYMAHLKRRRHARKTREYASRKGGMKRTRKSMVTHQEEEKTCADNLSTLMNNEPGSGVENLENH